MSESTAFLIDANILIQAHRQYYAFAIWPGFWDSLLHHHGTGQILSIDRVKDEIGGNDDLVRWVSTIAPKSLFSSTDEPLIKQKYAEIMKWVQGNRQFYKAAK